MLKNPKKKKLTQNDVWLFLQISLFLMVNRWSWLTSDPCCPGRRLRRRQWAAGALSQQRQHPGPRLGVLAPPEAGSQDWERHLVVCSISGAELKCSNMIWLPNTVYNISKKITDILNQIFLRFYCGHILKPIILKFIFISNVLSLKIISGKPVIWSNKLFKNKCNIVTNVNFKRLS